MQSDIDRWLSFAARVEEALPRINSENYSEQYLSGISDLLSALRQEAASLQCPALLDKRDGYSKANELAEKLRSTAYFAHHP